MPLTLRLSAATMIAISGLLVMIAMIGPSEKEWVMHLAAFLGAFLAGLWTARYFGHPGWDGILEATVGAIFATLLGTVIAGVLVSFTLPGFAGFIMVVIAPFVVLLGLSTPGPSTLIWALAMVVTHLAMRILRQWIANDGQP